MRVLVDVTHPAHVHLFRNAIDAFRERGHAVHVASREKDVTTDLLDAHGIDHTVLSRKRAGPLGVAREWSGRELRLLRLAAGFDPDVVLSRLNPAAAHVSSALGTPNVVFHDTEVAGLLDRVTAPFAAVVATPACFDRDLPAPHVRYEGFHELAYLHPARFTPDPQVLREAAIEPADPYSVVRLVAGDAHHDGGTARFSRDTVDELLARLAAHGEVYVSSEGPVPGGADASVPPVPVDGLHDLLAFADTYVGDSSTMATEAGVLGTPAVRYDPLDSDMGNFRALAEYGLVESTSSEQTAVDRAVELAADSDASRRWRRRRRHLLADNVDLTAFVVELTEEVGAP
jgi:predicted glycosyltransferase